MSVDYKELEKFAKSLDKAGIEKIEDACVKDLAARLLRAVVKKTPVGIYPKESGKVGGNLRRKWTVGNRKKTANGLSLDVINPTEYASYVEYGHRQEPGRYVPAISKRLKAHWVQGRFMLTTSEADLKLKAQRIVEAKEIKMLEEMLNGRK